MINCSLELEFDFFIEQFLTKLYLPFD